MENRVLSRYRYVRVENFVTHSIDGTIYWFWYSVEHKNRFPSYITHRNHPIIRIAQTLVVSVWTNCVIWRHVLSCRWKKKIIKNENTMSRPIPTLSNYKKNWFIKQKKKRNFLLDVWIFIVGSFSMCLFVLTFFYRLLVFFYFHFSIFF